MERNIQVKNELGRESYFMVTLPLEQDFVIEIVWNGAEALEKFENSPENYYHMVVDNTFYTEDVLLYNWKWYKLPILPEKKGFYL